MLWLFRTLLGDLRIEEVSDVMLRRYVRIASRTTWDVTRRARLERQY
jgi:hypothetical protein